MNRRAAIALTAAVVFALYPTWRFATGHIRAVAQTAAAPPSYLFVQTATRIDYKDGVMTLYDVPRQTLFFTDRPNRLVGNLPTDRFVERWTTDKGPNGFAAIP